MKKLILLLAVFFLFIGCSSPFNPGPVYPKDLGGHWRGDFVYQQYGRRDVYFWLGTDEIGWDGNSDIVIHIPLDNGCSHAYRGKWHLDRSSEPHKIIIRSNGIFEDGDPNRTGDPCIIHYDESFAVHGIPLLFKLSTDYKTMTTISDTPGEQPEHKLTLRKN